MSSKSTQGKKAQKEILKCEHCGDKCADDAVVFEGQNFCCHGCQSVYSLLKSCNLGAYYTYEETPGIKKLKARDSEAFAYLDTDDIVQGLVSFSSPNLVRISLRLPAMHCASCIWLIENFKRLVPGVIESRVNFVKREALFSYDPREISLRKLIEQLDTIGYTPDLNFEKSSGKKSSPASRRLIFQMGIAGFCFGNIMLLSFPDYLPGAGSVSETYRNFFGYINFVLALPVLLYSAQDYLKSAWQAVKQKQINMDVPITMGIFALFIRSSYEIFFEGGGGYMDSLAALIFFLLIGKWVQQKSYDSLSFERDYKSYFPISVQVLNGNREVARRIEEVEPNTQYRVRSGELIPFDSVLISGDGAIDYSFVSGESDPVTIEVGEKIFAGGRQIGASVVLESQKLVNQSYLTSLWNTKSEKGGSKIATFADRVGQKFTVAIILIALMSGVYWAVKDPSIALNAVSAVLIVACPCALALSFPFAFGNAVRLLGRRGFYLKNGEALGRMANVKDIVFDKTGTLTRKGNAEVRYHGEALIPERMAAIQAMTQHSSHPLSRYIHGFADSETVVPITNFKEVTGRGLQANIGAALFKLGSADFVGAKSSSNQSMLSEVYFAIDQYVLGKFSIDKRYHDGLPEIIGSLKKQYELHLVSGDNASEKPRMQALFGQNAGLYFDQMPHQKEEIIRRLESEGRRTAMVGDGLNDANALRVAHFGVSVADDVFRFSPASDAILTSENFTDIAGFFNYSKRVIRLVKWSFVISFLYNSVGLFFAVQGLLTPVIAAILMPISSLTVVAFVTLGSRYLFSKQFNIGKTN